MNLLTVILICWFFCFQILPVSDKLGNIRTPSISSFLNFIIPVWVVHMRHILNPWNILCLLLWNTLSKIMEFSQIFFFFFFEIIFFYFLPRQNENKKIAINGEIAKLLFAKKFGHHTLLFCFILLTRNFILSRFVFVTFPKHTVSKHLNVISDT